jgi:outer membrane protein OmpA-like peptidoglycan-associated protein
MESNTSAPKPAACEIVDCLEREKVELQSCLDRFDATQIQKGECGLSITIGCDSVFEANSDRMRPATCQEIDVLADILKKYPETIVKVDVHTDCVSSEEENLALSELRAWIIKKALVDNGVAPSRVTARGWGESKPVASNATEDGRKVNRRVIITLGQRKS